MENTTISEMRQSFQDGVDSIYNAIVGQGTTPSGKTPADLVNAIKNTSVSVKLPITLREYFAPASNVTPPTSNQVTFTLTITNREVTVSGTTSVSAGHGNYGSGTASVTIGTITKE